MVSLQNTDFSSQIVQSSPVLTESMNSATLALQSRLDEKHLLAALSTPGQMINGKVLRKRLLASTSRVINAVAALQRVASSWTFFFYGTLERSTFQDTFPFPSAGSELPAQLGAAQACY